MLLFFFVLRWNESLCSLLMFPGTFVYFDFMKHKLETVTGDMVISTHIFYVFVKDRVIKDTLRWTNATFIIKKTNPFIIIVVFVVFYFIVQCCTSIAYMNCGLSMFKLSKKENKRIKLAKMTSKYTLSSYMVECRVKSQARYRERVSKTRQIARVTLHVVGRMEVEYCD